MLMLLLFCCCKFWAGYVCMCVFGELHCVVLKNFRHKCVLSISYIDACQCAFSKELHSCRIRTFFKCVSFAAVFVSCSNFNSINSCDE